MTWAPRLATDPLGMAIDASHVGDLYSWGEKSIASLVQTIGGGGGNADTTVVLDEGASIDLEVALGAKQTNNSSGGDVSLTRSGDVLAAGRQSQGVSVQSVGGGGGRLLMDVGTVAAEGSPPRRPRPPRRPSASARTRGSRTTAGT